MYIVAGLLAYLLACLLYLLACFTYSILAYSTCSALLAYFTCLPVLLACLLTCLLGCLIACLLYLLACCSYAKCCQVSKTTQKKQHAWLQRSSACWVLPPQAGITPEGEMICNQLGEIWDDLQLGLWYIQLWYNVPHICPGESLYDGWPHQYCTILVVVHSNEFVCWSVWSRKD